MRAILGAAGLPGALVLALVCAFSLRPGFAAGGARYCSSGAVGRIAVHAPKTLEPLVAEAFSVSVDQARNGAYVRCAGGKLMACWIGANLECGKANLHR
jgi:hypothetical protein